MAADAFELGEHPGFEGSNPLRVGNVACERFGLDVVGVMFVGPVVPCRIAGEEYGVGRRSHVADFLGAFRQLTLIFVARETRATGAGAKRAAG